MATIKGKWVMNETLTAPAKETVTVNYKFTAKGYNVDYKELEGTAIYLLSDAEHYFQTSMVDYLYNFYFIGWDQYGPTWAVGDDDLGISSYIAKRDGDDVKYRTYDFGETEQTVSDTFYAWFTANAKEYVEEVIPEYTLRIDGVEVTDYDNVVVNGMNYKLNSKITAYKASVTGLGNESPTSQVYTKDDSFPTSFEEVTDSFGNIFIKIPTMYRKVDTVVDSQITAFTMSTAKVDDTYEPYSVFVKPNGEVMPYVLIGKYCTNSSTSMTSITSEIKKITIVNARTYARNLGTGYQQYDWQFQKLFVDLCLLIGQKVNFQDGTKLIESYLGIVNLDKNCWVDGVVRDDATWCIAYDPTKYVDNATLSTDGYVSAGYSAQTSGSREVILLGYSTSNPFFNYPKVAVENTSYNTYYCDAYYYSTGNHPVFSRVGDEGADSGLWHCSTQSTWSSNFGARLCYRPLDESI